MSPQTPSYHLQLELDKLKSCIHCGMCLPACPTYQVTGSEAESPRGRLYMMKKLLNGELEAEAVRPHLEQCLACHGCETACPSAVQYGKILLGAREDLAQKDRRPLRHLKRFIFQRILPNHPKLQQFGKLLRTYQTSGLQKLVRGLGLLKSFPQLAYQESLLPAVPEHQELHSGMSFGNPGNEPVVLLTGCVMDIFYNPVHWETIDVLVANDYYVRIPEQTCCGALAHHAGEADITRQLAKRNIDTMLKDHPQWVVVNSAGCGSSMKDYAHLLADEPIYAAKARHFSAKVIDVMELLAKKPLAPFQTPISETMTYHAACHLHHVQKVQGQPISLLSQIPQLKLTPLTQAEACCGSAGIYNLEHAELSQEILANKMQHIADACRHQGAVTVVTGNPGCLLQIEKGIQAAGLMMNVRHPISVLAQAYRPALQSSPVHTYVPDDDIGSSRVTPA